MNDNDFNKQEEVDKKAKAKEGFSNFLKKTSEGIQKGAKNVSEFTQKTIHDNKVKRYNPLFKEEFKKKSFKLPNVIQIVDDAVRRDIDVCEGAIGWTSKVNDVEILYLYDEWVKDSKIQFVPYAKIDAVYCVDNFDRNKFTNTDTIFERSTNEKIAELERIAYSLGARVCSVEISEADSDKTSLKLSAAIRQDIDSKQNDNVNKDSNETEKTKNKKSVKISPEFLSVNMQSQMNVSNSRMQSGKSVAYFEGSDNPIRPDLKWFAHDDNIKGLVEMRCTERNLLKCKTLHLKGSTSSTMSRKTACAIDKILNIKGSLSMEKQSIKEHSSTLIFEIEF